MCERQTITKLFQIKHSMLELIYTQFYDNSISSIKDEIVNFEWKRMN